MTTAQILRRLRNDKHLSQKDVADALGIDRTTYVKYENGGSIKKNLQELANFYSVSTDYLLGRNNAAKQTGKSCTSPDSILDIENSVVLDAGESEHIKKYRALTAEHKGAIDNQLEYFYKIDQKASLQPKE